MSFVNKVFSFLSEHKAFSLTLANLILVLLIFFQKDPVGLFHKTYDTSESFYKITKSELGKIVYGRTSEPNSNKELIPENSSWKTKVRGNQYKADEEKVEQFWKSLLHAKKFTVVTSSKDKASEFGFGGPDSFFVEMFSGEKSIGKLHIGNLASGGNSTYVKWNDSDEIYLVEDNLKLVMGKGGDDYFINKKINPSSFSTDELFAVSLKDSVNPKKNYELIKRDSAWFSGASEKLEEDKVKSLLSRITSISVDDIFLESSLPELQDTNRYQLSYTYKRGESNSTNFLEILGKDKASNHYYFRLNNEPTIYKCNGYQLQDILDWEMK